MARVALITGIAGQDGSYLAELLLSRGYEVHGILRKATLEDKRGKLNNIEHILDRVHLHAAVVENHLSMNKVVAEIMPNECYHLASSSFVSYDFDDEVSLLQNNFMATHALLAAIHQTAPECRIYFAGSSEMFGEAEVSPQDERTPFNPRSIYGISKLAAFHLVRNYREHKGLFLSTGISYNHESVRRGHKFVTRKVSTAVAKIYLGITDTLELGNIDAYRDWGYAPDYVKAMHAMLQQDDPDDYVIATGVSRSIRELLDAAFSVVNLDYDNFLKIDTAHYRPSEKLILCGNFSKAQSELGWKPSKSFGQMIEEMVEYDVNSLKEKT
jgi:GDPmannose 4,6-dehydratase